MGILPLWRSKNYSVDYQIKKIDIPQFIFDCVRLNWPLSLTLTVQQKKNYVNDLIRSSGAKSLVTCPKEAQLSRFVVEIVGSRHGSWANEKQRLALPTANRNRSRSSLQPPFICVIERSSMVIIATEGVMIAACARYNIYETLMVYMSYWNLTKKRLWSKR